MEISLKKVKVSHELSEETVAFTADLYVDDKNVGTVKNHGQGGSHDIYLDPAHRDLYKKLSNMDTEFLISELVVEVDLLKRQQSKGFVLRKPSDDPIMSFEYATSKFPMPITKLRQHKDYKNWLKKQRQSFAQEGWKVINTNL